jgi:riboflavin-specific deaminase-like protein
MTHHLRSRHDAILVGINTVLADDPRLTVRLVEGRDPKPVVIDGKLRIPLAARLLHNPTNPPVIVTSEVACSQREESLRQAGAKVLRLPVHANGRIDLSVLMARLGAMNVRSIMVEGGAGIISYILAARLADQAVVTVSPRFVGGFRAVKRSGATQTRPRLRLRNPRYQSLGGDLIICGDLKRKRSHRDAAMISRPAPGTTS